VSVAIDTAPRSQALAIARIGKSKAEPCSEIAFSDRNLVSQKRFMYIIKILIEAQEKFQRKKNEF